MGVADHCTYLALVVAANGGLCADAHSHKDQQKHSNCLHWHPCREVGAVFRPNDQLGDANLPFAAQSHSGVIRQGWHPSSTLYDCDKMLKLTVQL